MKITSATETLIPPGTDALAIPLIDEEAEPTASVQDTPIAAVLKRLLDAKALSAGVGEVTPILGATDLGAESVVTFGLGKRERFEPGVAYQAGVALAKKLSGKPRGKVAVAVPEAGELDKIASALTEGLVVGTRGPGLKKKEPGRQPFESLTLVARGANAGSLEKAVRRGEIVGEAVNVARELVNTPPADKAPALLAERARALAEEAGVKATVWDETRIRDERFGGLLGVADGSENPPRFVVLEWKNGGDRPTIALVGKGVTFDSGGLSLKPSASMEDMKSDMTGAAAVLASICAAARLGLPVNVVGYLPLTENMTGGRAMKLGDVLTMRNGKTVEVLNTDAEGRLILADALSYAAESRPGRVVDLATLTGACMVALGLRYAGLFGNDDALVAAIEAASKATGERTWRLPLDDDFFDGLKSTVADMKNVGGKWGGAITAAKFLEQFAGEIPWAHLDIAGPSWADSDSPTRDAGGTGCFVRTLVAFLEAGS